jgi:acetyl esterase/lipase
MTILALLAALLAPPATLPSEPLPLAKGALPEAVVDEESGVRWYRDVAYVEGPQAHRSKHRLDLLLPDPEKRRPGRPMLIWIHGGGWVMGDKDDALGLYTRYCRILAENGVATANVSYRLSPGVKHPAHIQDVAAAAAWVIGRAAELGVDPEAVFVSGHSAGGHLAALLATDPQWLEAHGVDHTIAGALPSSGVFEMKALVESGPRWQRAFAVEDAVDASPVTHADKADPPFALFVESNGAFMRGQTRAMAQALKAAGIEPQVVTLAGVNHITMLMDLLDPGGVHATTTLKFIDQVVGASRARPADAMGGRAEGAEPGQE